MAAYDEEVCIRQLNSGSTEPARAHGRRCAREARLKAIPAGRFGDPAEFGDACAYLCSAQAGYLTAQKVLIDGAGCPGTM